MYFLESSLGHSLFHAVIGPWSQQPLVDDAGATGQFDKAVVGKTPGLQEDVVSG